MPLPPRILAEGPASRRTALASAALAALVAAIVLLPLLGHKPLAEWDEAIYAEVSREMLGNSWLVPHWNLQPWFEKPPLTLWITAAFFKLFGVSDFTARAGSAFSAIALVTLLNAWLARRRDVLTAALSSVILLATFGFLHIAHVGETDVLLSLGCLLALLGLAELRTEDAPVILSGYAHAVGVEAEGPATPLPGHSSPATPASNLAWPLFFLGFAIAVMTKGAAAIVLPITALAFLRRRTLTRHFFTGLGILLALTLPWHVVLYHRCGHAFLAEYLGLHTITRATQQIEGHHTHWWYYVVVLVVSTPPFFLLYPSAIARGLRRQELRPFAIFTFVTLVLYSCAQTRLPHYIAPVYPALALLTAILVADFLRSHPVRPAMLLGAAAVWAVTILATHSTLKSLHSATLAGPNLRDNREADALLKARSLPTIPGPLLVWRNGQLQSIATLIFYSGHEVILVDPNPTPSSNPTRYQPTPQPLACPAPRCLLLLDTTNLRNIPANLHFDPIASSPHLTLGTLHNKL